MIVAITGGSTLPTQAELDWLVRTLGTLGATVLAHTASRGVAIRCAAEVVQRLPAVQVIAFHPQWRTGLGYNARAAFDANEQMLTALEVDVLLAWPGGPDVAHCVRFALEHGIEVRHLTSV